MAAYACQFSKPFWGAPFTFQGNTRTVALPPFAGSVTITETLQAQTPSSNEYTMTGLPQIDSYFGSFALTPTGPDTARLTWQIRFAFQDSAALLIVAQLFAGASSAMTSALQQEFGLLQPTAA
ncbi:hypothetical protein [Hymenobacter cellulosilyticus]|uniref:Uncharacterized protein n=1 Tax=Hymenobacter cellulosilyticus TaxID=2932248 RepID=A0A8T9QA47_9BACT|nr:hypothetical protein [Hymenobacter cellulosilyticus]UOQ72690.1 hypothetical protein MUN79_01460 [Hymenobacter cellulosilyticus]